MMPQGDHLKQAQPRGLWSYGSVHTTPRFRLLDRLALDPCQRNSKTWIQSSSCKTWKPHCPPTWSLVGKCRWTGHGPCLCGCWTFVAAPLVSVSNKGLVLGVLWANGKKTKWSSGAEESFSLWPKNGEGGAHAVKYMFSLKVLWWNCFIGFLSVGRGGVGFLLVIPPDCIAQYKRLCTCPAITILNWAVVQCLYTSPTGWSVRCMLPTRSSGLKCWLQGLHMWYPVTK